MVRFASAKEGKDLSNTGRARQSGLGFVFDPRKPILVLFLSCEELGPAHKERRRRLLTVPNNARDFPE